jgi:putative membrane protein
MKRIFAFVGCILICSIPSLAQKKAPRESGMSDQQFINFAGQTDMTDANLGQLAGTAASSQPVKDFAHKLVTDQTSDFQQLSEVAHEANLNVPSAIDKEHNRMTIDPVEKLRGNAFDHRFAEEMVAGETKAVDIYEKEAANAHNPALRSYAEEALPVLQTDLSEAKNMEKAKAPAKKG